MYNFRGEFKAVRIVTWARMGDPNPTVNNVREVQAGELICNDGRYSQKFTDFMFAAQCELLKGEIDEITIEMVR